MSSVANANQASMCREESQIIETQPCKCVLSDERSSWKRALRVRNWFWLRLSERFFRKRRLHWRTKRPAEAPWNRRLTGEQNAFPHLQTPAVGHHR